MGCREITIGQAQKDEEGQVRTAKLLLRFCGSCSDRTGRHWQRDHEWTFPRRKDKIGEVLVSEWQGEGNSERTGRKPAVQKRKWPQEAASTELPGGWCCPPFYVKQDLGPGWRENSHVWGQRAPGDLLHCGEAM